MSALVEVFAGTTMKTHLLAVLVLLLLLAASQVRSTDDDWCEPAGAASWSVAAALLQMSDDDAKGVALDRKMQQARERNRSRAEIVDALVDGRLTLAEAATRFRTLNRQARIVFWHDPDKSQDELLCLQVLRWARDRLKQRGIAPDAPIMARLEAEFAALTHETRVTFLPEETDPARP